MASRRASQRLAMLSQPAAMNRNVICNSID
jgi:hypothetical protein